MSRHGKVLLIDDDPDAVAGLAAILETESIETIIIDSLLKLPFYVKKHCPDVIVTDIRMPALSGTALLSGRLNQMVPTHVPVLLFSGIDADELWRLADETGAAGALPKSQDVDRTILQLKTWIRHSQMLQQPGGKQQ